MSLTSRGYQREVLAILRDEYGVTDAEIFNGGHHPRVRFTYEDHHRTLTLNRVVRGPGDLAQKRRDITRELGVPPPRPQPTRVKRNLEEMLPMTVIRSIPQERDPLSSPDFLGKIMLACYPDKGNKRRFILYAPEAIRTRFPAGVTMTTIDAETWQFSTLHKPKPSFGKRDGNNCGVQIPVGDSTDVFGRSPVEACWVDGALVVRLPLDKRRPKLEGVFRSPAKTSALPTLVAGVTPEQIRQCLETLRRIEAETPYRLVRGKDTGAWAFVSRIE